MSGNNKSGKSSAVNISVHFSFFLFLFLRSSLLKTFNFDFLVKYLERTKWQVVYCKHIHTLFFLFLPAYLSIAYNFDFLVAIFLTTRAYDRWCYRK